MTKQKEIKQRLKWWNLMESIIVYTATLFICTLAFTLIACVLKQIPWLWR